MKRMAVLLSFMLVCGFAFAAEERVAPETRLLAPEEITTDGVTESEEGQWLRSSACAASTVCYSGRYIGCTASGLVTRCYRGSGSYVACEAWGSHGTYSRAVDTCP